MQSFVRATSSSCRIQSCARPAVISSFRGFSSAAEFRLRFGKHKGKTLGEVPEDYRRWMIEQRVDVGKPDLAAALAELGYNDASRATTFSPFTAKKEQSPRPTPEQRAKFWDDMKNSPGEWIDCRHSAFKRRNPRYPDFKSVNGQNAMWLDSHETPEWARSFDWLQHGVTQQ